MNFKSFVQSLGRGFSRNRLVESHVMLNREASDVTIPMLQLFLARVKPAQLNGGALGKRSKEFFRGVKVFGRSKHMLEHIEAVFSRLVAMAGEIEDDITASIGKSDTQDTMTYKGANLTQYVQVFQFANSYVRKLLLDISENINNENGKATIKFQSGLTSPEKEWLRMNSSAFIAAMSALTEIANGLKKGLAAIPDVVVELSDESSANAVHGLHNLDPFGLGLVGNEAQRQARSGFVFTSPAFSIIYHLRMMYADWEISRYNAAKEERQALEYRIQALADSLDGVPNPKVEAAIEAHTTRLNKINYDLAKMEESINERG